MEKWHGMFLNMQKHVLRFLELLSNLFEMFSIISYVHTYMNTYFFGKVG